MYFEAASQAPIEIRPLIVFYGMMALAKGIVAGRTLRNLSALSQAHGLRDISEHGARLPDLRVKVDGQGTFQDFNNIVCELEGLIFFEHAMTQKCVIPTARSPELDQAELTLRNVLARTPRLEGLYKATYAEEAGALLFSLHLDDGPSDLVALRIDVAELYDDPASLARIIGALREKYPMLRNWRFQRAEKAWDNSIFTLVNCAPFAEEFDPASLVEHGPGGFRFERGMLADVTSDFRERMLPVAGGLLPVDSYLIQPVDGLYVSEAALKYAGMYLLSSLVRYRPQIWVHAVSRLVTPDRNADDSSLALIEDFMSSAQSTFSALAIRLLTEP
jgi:hypothetical protein